MTILLRSTSIAALVFVLTGCTTTPPTALKTGDVPPGFTAPLDQHAPLWPASDWWYNLNAPELPAFEQAAQQENLDLAAASARVLQAQANVGIAGSALFPLLQGTGKAERAGSNQRGLVLDPTTGRRIGNTTNTFGIGAQASYEVDLWGLNQDELRQAEENELSARYA